MEEQTVEIGSGNVFADLGLENPEELLLKAQLGVEIANVVARKGLTDAAAAGTMAISEDEWLALRNNPLGHSTGELLHLLNRLDQEVQVVVTPRLVGREQTAA